MNYFIALLIFIAVYIITSFILELKPKTSTIAEPLGVIVGLLASLLYLGFIH